MDNRKFCFIYCVDNENQFNESLKQVNLLNVPLGYSIEHIAVRNASCITDGYNYAMRNTGAKYKIYIHQDVKILDQNCLLYMLALFKKYARLGMLGVVGTKKLPSTGVWWGAWEHEKFGKVYYNGLLAFKEVTNDYQSVQAVDGLIMITQYDRPWRADLFKGWHFYDASQSLEFLRAGYDLGVPRQFQPWCEHRPSDADMTDYEINRLIFLREYRNFLENYSRKPVRMR